MGRNAGGREIGGWQASGTVTDGKVKPVPPSTAPVPDVDALPMRQGFPSFSRAEIARRHAAPRDLMEAEGITLLAAYAAGRFNAETLYLSNWPGGREGYFLLPMVGEPQLLVQLFNHGPQAQQLSLVLDTGWAGPDSVVTLARVIKAQRADQRRSAWWGHGASGIFSVCRGSSRMRSFATYSRNIEPCARFDLWRN